jgi:hypothetical protein
MALPSSGAVAPPASPGGAATMAGDREDSAAVVVAGTGEGAEDGRRAQGRSEDDALEPPTEEAQHAQALLLLKAPDDVAAVKEAPEVGVWGPDGPPQPAGRQALFEVGGIVTAPAKGYSARWSADNRVGLVCGATIYVHTLGVSRQQAGGPGVTYLPERKEARQDYDLGGETFPKNDGMMSAAKKFQLAPVMLSRRPGEGAGHIVNGTLVESKPSFRGLDWSPPMPACGGECLMVTCSTDHRVGVYSAPVGRKTTWHEVVCLSDELELLVEKLQYKPRPAAIPGCSAAGGAPVEILRRKALLSNLSVAWSQRSSGSGSPSPGKFHTWIAVGGVGSLAVFKHTTVAHPAPDGEDKEPSHKFECLDLVSLPGEASYVTALAWLDEGPAPSASGVAAGCPALVSGSGSGMVVLWATSAAGSEAGSSKLNPMQVICTADNSPVLSLLPAPWITPRTGSGPTNSARLAVAKGTGVWIWEHGNDPWATGAEVTVSSNKRARSLSGGEAQDSAKRAKADSGAPAASDDQPVPHWVSVGQMYFLPKVGPSTISGAAWARDLSPSKAEGSAKSGRIERAVLLVTNLESHTYGYEGIWSDTIEHSVDGSRLVPSDRFSEQQADAGSACIWGLAGSPNSLVLAVLIQNPDTIKYSSTAETMFTNHRARVSYSLRPGLSAGQVVELLAAKLEALQQKETQKGEASAACASGLTPVEFWEFAECCIAHATDPADVVASAAARAAAMHGGETLSVGSSSLLQLKICKGLERAVFERRLSSCKQQTVDASAGVANAYVPAQFAGHQAAKQSKLPVFAHHELQMQRVHVEQSMRALEQHLRRSKDLDPQVRRAAWRMVLCSEQMVQAMAPSSCGSNSNGNGSGQELAELSAALRTALVAGLSSEAAAAEEEGMVEVCPTCKGALSRTGLLLASCDGSPSHRWSRCCYSLELLGLQSAEPGGWLRSSIWPSCTARATVAWSLAALLGQPAPLCPATGTAMLPARGTL